MDGRVGEWIVLMRVITGNEEAVEKWGNQSAFDLNQ